MRKRTLVILMILVLTITLLLSFSACNNEIDLTKGKINVTDSLSYTVGFDETPKRVVALQSSVADVWLLAGGSIVGISDDFEDYGLPINKDEVTIIGETHYTDIEYIVNLEPDFIIYSTKHDKENIEKLKAAHIKTFGAEIETFEDYLYVLSQFTKLTGRDDLYKKNGLDVQNSINSVKQSVPQGDKRSYLFLRTRSTSSPTIISSSHFVTDMLNDLNMQNIAASSGKEGNLSFSLEEVVKQNPDYIFITFMGVSNVVKSKKWLEENILNQNSWQSLDAVKNGRVIYLYDENHLERAHYFQYKPNEKWAEAYSYLYDILY